MLPVIARTIHTSPCKKMKWTEVSAVLRPFYLKVHPDMFMNFPKARQANEDSLKDLNLYLETLTRSRVPDNKRLEFYIKQEASTELRQVKLDLRGKGLLDALKLVLSSVQLPTDNVSLKSKSNSSIAEEDEYGYREENSSYWTMHPDNLYGFRGAAREMGLLEFFDHNVDIALERTRAAQPTYDEVARVEEQVLNTLELKEVSWDCGWGVAHYRAGLLALLKLNEHHPEIKKVLKGRKLIFGKWTGVSLEGNIILSSGDVRHCWLEFLRELDTQFKFVDWVPHSERILSEVLRGIQISHERLNGRTLAFKYLIQVDKLSKAIQRWLWLNNFPSELPHDLSAYTLVVENDAGPMMVSHSGELIVPSSCPAEVFIDFLMDNLKIAEQAMLSHSVNVIEEQELKVQVVWKLGLRELSKDETISSSRMVKCLRALLDDSDKLSTRLQDCHLRVSNCYSVLQDGILCIPAHWKP